MSHHDNKQYQMAAGDEGWDASLFSDKRMDESSGSETGTTSADEIKLVEITITVTEAKIMKGPRNEPFISFVTVEMGDNVLAISDHCDLKEDNTFPFLLTFKLQANVGDYYKIDEFICKPLIFTESAGLSKKVKDTISLCLCSVDMLPILLSTEMMQTRKYIMEFFEPPVKEPPIKPEIELKIHFSNGLLGQELLRQCNIIQFTLETCHSLPGELILDSKPEELFVVGCSLPLLQESDEPIVFRNGTIVDGPNYAVEKKWYTANLGATGKALHIANSYIQTESLEDDVGDFQDEKGREFRQTAERLAKPIIAWNSEFRSLISPAANYKLIQRIREYKHLPLEFTRVIPGVKKKEMSYNAVAYVNLTPILFPGITTIHGAYELHPLSEVDMKTRTNKSSLFIRGTPTRQGSMFLMSTLQKKSLGREEGVEKEKPKENLETIESPQLFEGTYSEEATLFEENRTYLTLKISLLHPLVQQRLPEEIRQTILELIPNRNIKFPKVDSAQKAVEDFGTQVCNTAALLLEDYKSLLIKDAAGSQTKDRLTTQDYRKTKFMHELKKNGKYFACKEQLKYHIVKIVRDKFLRRSSFDSQQEFEEFLTTLYVYIIEEMHRSLNKYFGIADPTAPLDPITSSEELRSYATDAFAVGRFDLAEKYHQLRIERFGTDPGCWVDYGIYCLGVGAHEKSAECFRHSLSIDNEYFRGLLLYGMVCDVCGRTDQTETFLLHAVNSNPTKAVAHTIVGLYYQGIGNSIGAETYYKQAYELARGGGVTRTAASDSTPSYSAEDIATGATGDDSSIFLSILPFLLNCYVALYSLRALAQDLTSFQCNPRGNYHLYLAKLRFQEGDYVSAELAIRDALEQDNTIADVWSLSGHIYYAMGNKNKAKQNFTRALAIQKSPVDLHIVYYKLGQIAMDAKEYDIAKKNFLLTCKYSPSSLSWIGVGRACYFEEEFIEAEEALSEANILDNTNPEVWGYLTLVALKTGRQEEVEQAYRFCCKCDLKDKNLFEEIRTLADEVGMSLTPV